MIDYLSSPVAHEAFFKKYASKKFLKGIYFSASRSTYFANLIPASIVLRRWAKEYVANYSAADTTTPPPPAADTTKSSRK
jgi:G2/mitotic-specific cyclin 1/2